MSSPVPDMASNSSALTAAFYQDVSSGRGGQAGWGRRSGQGGQGGRENENGGHGRKVFNQMRRPKLWGSFQVMGGHVFELPEESNDQTQYSKTIGKWKSISRQLQRDVPGYHKLIHWTIE